MIKNRMLVILVACAVLAQVSFGDVWDDLAKYRYGDDPNPCEQLETILQDTPVKQYGTLESKLIAIVSSKSATEDGKANACRFLQQVGTDNCIGAVSGLLADEVLSDYARLVLERLKCAAADEALRDGLATAPDAAKIGILGSLGERGDVKAVAAAAKLAKSGDGAVATAAIGALGKIGGREAAGALMSVRPAKGKVSVHLRAMAECAGSVSGLEAVMLCRKVLSGPAGPWQVAAIRALIKADAVRASYSIGRIVKGDDLNLRRGVLGVVGETKDVKLAKAMVDLLGGLDAERKAQVIGVIGVQGCDSSLESLAGYLVDKDAAVRNAAIKAVGRIGGERVVEQLLGAAASTGSEDVAIQAIVAMQGEGVDAVVVKLLKSRAVRGSAIKACAARGCTGAVGDLLKLAKDRDADVRKDSWAGLAVLADGEDMKSVMAIVVGITDSSELAAAGGAIKEIYARSRDKGKCFETVADSYGAASKALKFMILDLGAVVGDSTALKLEKDTMASGDKELYGRALRALAKWPNKSAADDLLKEAKGASEMVDRIVATRGYIRIASLDRSGLSSKERVEMLKTAMEISQRADEKKAAISALQNVKHIDALNMLKGYLDDTALGTEAEMSAANLIWELRSKNRDEVGAVAERLAKSKSKAVSDRAKKTLAELKKK